MGWMRTDDVDGSAPATQITFGLDGKCYTLDLGRKNTERLHAALQPFLTVAAVYAEMPAAPGGEGPVEIPEQRDHKVVPLTTVPAGQKAVSRVEVPVRTIRAWAQSNGYGVGPKGRIPDEVVSAYHAAHDPS